MYNLELALKLRKYNNLFFFFLKIFTFLYIPYMLIKQIHSAV